MLNVFDIGDLSPAPANGPERKRWTAVIPAAGRGTRLGADVPKIFFEIGGRSVLNWIVGALEPFCERLVVVANPSSSGKVSKELDALVPGRGQVVVQAEPRGMADAVACGIASVVTPNTLVLWGDQAGVRKGTIARCIGLHAARAPKLTLPTIVKDDPYIDFERSPDGRLTGVYQRREADVARARGENDCGLFLFETAALRSVLSEGMHRPDIVGAKTGERSFLALLPFLDLKAGDVLSVRITDAEETLGVNTTEDARLLSSVLARRKEEK